MWLVIWTQKSLAEFHLMSHIIFISWCQHPWEPASSTIYFFCRLQIICRAVSSWFSPTRCDNVRQNDLANKRNSRTSSHFLVPRCCTVWLAARAQSLRRHGSDVFDSWTKENGLSSKAFFCPATFRSKMRMIPLWPAARKKPKRAPERNTIQQLISANKIPF